ncbi:MAG: hypothetical protein WD512_20470 [Candidatus Paceibacterota bacterium]
MDWFVKAIFGEISVSNGTKAQSVYDNKSFDLSKIVTAKEANIISLEKYDREKTETLKKNFEDCKKSIFENFIVGKAIQVECKTFMSSDDQNFIKEIMASKGYHLSYGDGGEKLRIRRDSGP